MTFNPLNFRHLPDNAPKIRNADICTLILVKSDGAASYGRTRAAKDEIVASYTPDDLLLLAWTGKYHTDIFHLSTADIAAFYR